MLVSCIMPTRDRRCFVEKSIEYFLKQTYQWRELIIIDDGDSSIRDIVPLDKRILYLRLDQQQPIGAKRNLACKIAKGDVIVHWDDDDWFADWRLSYQVEELIRNRADICGLHKVFHYDLTSKKAWLYIYDTGRGKPWVAGGTFTYTKSFWKRHHFLNINVGEDTRFLWDNYPQNLLVLTDPSFYVALIHPKNTTRKHMGQNWYSVPYSEVKNIMGDDWYFYDSPSLHEHSYCNRNKSDHKEKPVYDEPPLVSCIMPTYNRQPFIEQTIKYFLRQDYINKELIIIDDGTDPIKRLLSEADNIRYIRLPKRYSIGIKRNIACGLAGGELIIFWDDDDWYSSNRISYQVQPIVEGEADITALSRSLMYSLEDGKFWTCSDNLFKNIFVYGVHGGTLAFWKRLWNKNTYFPDTSLAEDADFLKNIIRDGAGLKKLDNSELYIYVRHSSTAWSFIPGDFFDKTGWRQVDMPSFLPEEDISFYHRVAEQLKSEPYKRKGV